MSQFKPHPKTVTYSVAAAARASIDRNSNARHIHMRRLAAKRQRMNKIARKSRKAGRGRA